MGALQLIDDHGEVVRAVDATALLAAGGIHDVTASEVIELAEFTANAVELVRVAKEAQGVVSDELVRRLDLRGKWTLRDGGFEIKSSSPEAGTVGYDTDLLLAALTGLVENGVIAVEAAHAALEPIVCPAAVPYELLREIAAGLRGELDVPGEARVASQVERLLAGEPVPVHKQRPAGIKALLKLRDARDAIEACQVETVPPRRAAKVKRLVPA